MSNTNAISKQVIHAVLMYSAASGTMLVVNKVVLSNIPMPSLVSSIQFIFATLICLFLKFSKLQIVVGFTNVINYIRFIMHLIFSDDFFVWYLPLG